MAFYGLHSLLASARMKRFAARGLRLAGRYYRLAYNGLNLVLLFVLLREHLGESHPMLFTMPALGRGLGLLLMLGGLVLLRFAFARFPLKAFAGLEEEEHGDLVESGVYSWARHPLYSASLLLAIGLFLVFPRTDVLSALVAMMVYLPFGIYFEEEKLLKVYGEAYRRYRSRTGALFPRFKSRP